MSSARAMASALLLNQEGQYDIATPSCALKSKSFATYNSRAPRFPRRHDNRQTDFKIPAIRLKRVVFPTPLDLG